MFSGLPLKGRCSTQSALRICAPQADISKRLIEVTGRCRPMFVTKALARSTMCAGLMALPSAIPTTVYAQQTVTVGATEIGGTVVSAAGPEAGVWVIAETTDLPTKFARIVVTDDSGRYL